MDAKVPTLITSRLILRQVNPTDYPSYHKNINDYEVIKYLSSKVPWPYPENGVAFYMENVVAKDLGVDRWLWGICLKEKPDEVVGAVELWRNPCPENRGFWLARKYWGQGFMSEATDKVNEYAFNHLGFDKLILSNAVGNLASRRIKEKNGARLLNIREAQFVAKEFTHAETWELTKNDWKNSLTI